MRKGIHLPYHPVAFQDTSTGDRFPTRSTATSNITITWADGHTYPLITLDVTSASHPFWTGEQRVVETAGQVESFRRRYGTRAGGERD